MVWRATVDDIATMLKYLQLAGYESRLSTKEYVDRQNRRSELKETLTRIGIELGDDPEHPDGRRARRGSPRGFPSMTSSSGPRS